jgi:hypothetical protein
MDANKRECVMQFFSLAEGSAGKLVAVSGNRLSLPR